jgi:hypothetical protein
MQQVDALAWVVIGLVAGFLFMPSLSFGPRFLISRGIVSSKRPSVAANVLLLISALVGFAALMAIIAVLGLIVGAAPIPRPRTTGALMGIGYIAALLFLALAPGKIFSRLIPFHLDGDDEEASGSRGTRKQKARR